LLRIRRRRFPAASVAGYSARWLVSTIDQALGALHAGGVHINCPFAEPLYGDMDDTGVEWQQQLGDWWQSDKPWLRLCIWKAKSSATGFLAAKARRGRRRADERRKRKKCRVGENPRLAADWRCPVADRAAAAVRRPVAG
jgi:2-succinyl-5-enolpyruvyl-6-hydroxy-3-cyclohexene-1-carboxylate synthase